MDENDELLLHLQHLKLPHVHGGMEHGKEKLRLVRSPDNPDRRRVWPSVCRLYNTG